MISEVCWMTHKKALYLNEVGEGFDDTGNTEEDLPIVELEHHFDDDDDDEQPAPKRVKSTTSMDTD